MTSPLKYAIKELLSFERGGVVLAKSVVDVATNYLVDVAKVEDVDEVDVTDLLTIAKEGWAEAYDGATLPGMHVRPLTRWCKNQKKTTEASSKASLKDDEDSEDDDDSALFGAAGPTTRALRTLSEDKDTQGLAGVRILVLSVALELGRVPAASEVVGSFTYGSDPRLGDLAKQQRKAGVTTLNKVLESNSVRRDLTTFIGGLVRDYSERRQIEEAALITQWWSETQTVSNDDKILAEYIREWLRKYPGRGIPSVIDVVIATRVTGSRGASGASPEQLKELKDALKSAKDSMAALKSELKQEISSLRSQVGTLKGELKDPASKLGKGPVCHNCGERGHIARNCPHKEKPTKEVESEKEE